MAWTAQRLLTLIGAATRGECISEARLAELSGYGAKQVENACQNLRRHGFIARSAKGCHRLTAAGHRALEAGVTLKSGPRGPETGVRRRDPGLRQRAWNALRSGKKLTVDDLIMRAADGTERDPRSNLRKYLRALARAGIVFSMPVRERALNPTSNGAIRWWLISDVGPLAPIYRARCNLVYDPNGEHYVAPPPFHAEPRP